MKKYFAVFKGIGLSLVLIIGTMLFMLGEFEQPTIISERGIVNVCCGALLIFAGVMFVCLMTYEAYESKLKEEHS